MSYRTRPIAMPENWAPDRTIDSGQLLCMDLCMATKTLSVDEEAYLRLVRARRHARESFSQVIKRASWDQDKKRCGDLLVKASGEVSEATLDRLEAAQQADLPPEDKWNR